MTIDGSSGASGKPAPDIVDLWKLSEERRQMTASLVPNLSATSTTTRSSLWSGLSEMAPADQAKMMSRISQSWPYANERRALTWTMPIGLAANCITTAAITTKISADMILYNSRTPFLETVQKCKSPFALGVYASGVAYFALHQVFITPLIYGEDRPCESCVLSRSVAIAVSTGVAIPMLSTPYLAYYIMLQRTSEKYPALKSYIEVLSLWWEGSKAARPAMKWAIPLQIAVASIGAYATLWGRNRFFATLDSDQELSNELLHKAIIEKDLREKVIDFFKNVPGVSAVLNEKGPEQERLRTR